MTPKRAGSAVIACWLVALIVGLTPMFGWNNLKKLSTNNSEEANPIVTCQFEKVISMEYMVYFNFFGWVLPPLVLMLVIYVEIFYMIHKQLNKKLNKAASQADPSRYYGKELKLAKSLALVLFFFAFSWLPLHILNCITLFCPTPNTNTIIYVAILLSHVNSAVNPVIYAFRIKKFRTAFVKIWAQYVCCRKVNHLASKATRRRECPEKRMRRINDI